MRIRLSSARYWWDSRRTVGLGHAVTAASAALGPGVTPPNSGPIPALWTENLVFAPLVKRSLSRTVANMNDRKRRRTTLVWSTHRFFPAQRRGASRRKPRVGPFQNMRLLTRQAAIWKFRKVQEKLVDQAALK